ncbi:MAG TPA: DUF3810 domain-containing protein [Blastocatellia bacterium]|nr:DUF3810 domain-containing protein [Blastocatellia bacterium]
MSQTQSVEVKKGTAGRGSSIKARLLGLFKRRPSAGAAIKIVIIITAAATALFPLPAGFVERFYSNGLYPWLQSWLTPFANLLPFALVDALLIALVLGVPAWWAVRIWRAGRGRRLRAVASLTLDTLVLAGAIFLSFQLLWGFNYMREPLTFKLEYDQQRITSQTELAMLRLAVEQLNRETADAHSSSWAEDGELRRVLEPPFEQTVAMMGNGRKVATAIPKRTLLDRYLGATGVDGFTNPFGHEVLLNSDLLATEKPFTLAHEWAHLAGYADESEANFVAFLTCVRSEQAAVRYSGWLALYSYLASVRHARIDDEEFAASIPALAPEVKADLRAIIERSQRRLSPSISRVQGEVYDRYLKANRVEAGIESYSLMVRLMLGTRFDDGWAPARRGS